nr:MAG: ORF1 [TTV-like mini virus]
MPYYNYWRYPRWRRRRRLWRRRPRGFIRRRLWRRRFPVRRRKRKLKRLTIKEWQPYCIRKCTIKGMYCLLQCHKYRLTNNWAQYEASTVPQHEPGGGGFSILRFNLDALYEQNQLCRNVWTKSNKNLPLVRYTGMSFKIYRPDDVDLVVKIQNCYPMSATPLLYTSTQPAIALMSKNSYKIPSKKTQPRGKPYKKIRVPPPAQMQNGWYFQKDIVKTGLVLITTTACSFDHYYISTKAENNNISLLTLNTTIFQNRFFKNTSTTGYYPKENFYIYATENGDDNPKHKDMIWLGNTQEYQLGQTVNSMSGSDTTQKIQAYLGNRKHWGNMFHHDYINKQRTLWLSKKPPAQAITTSNFNNPIGTDFTKMHQELIEEVRYNPQKDTGKDTKVYLLPNWKDESGWDPPNDTDLILEGFPAWLIIWGFLDFQLKLAKVTQIAAHYMVVIQSPYFEPKKSHYIFLDQSFYDGTSPFLDERTTVDNLNWYPMTHFQQQALDTLGGSGPATAKLNGKNMVEAKCEYKFHFKFGGCVPPMEKAKDPSEQPIYPIPHNIIQPTSLQSPETPIEQFLYSFDQRRGYLTEKAAQRITKDWTFTDSLFTDTKSTATDLQLQHPQKEEDQTSEEEAQEETLFQQLNLQRRKQQKLRQRIKLLLAQIQSIE